MTRARVVKESNSLCFPVLGKGDERILSLRLRETMLKKGKTQQKTACVCFAVCKPGGGATGGLTWGVMGDSRLSDKARRASRSLPRPHSAPCQTHVVRKH